jgi:uncharacterized membrane protein YdjX (TVP38/TMEM64 family)
MAEQEQIEQIEGGGRIRAIRTLVFSLILLAAAILFISKEMVAIQNFISENGTLGLLFSIVVYGILGASLIPSEPLTVMVGAVFGPWIATLVATLGNLLAAIVEYYIGERLGHASSFEKRRERLPFGLSKFPVHSPAFLIFCRMVPGYGPKLVSVLAGVYRVPIRRYVWTTMIPTAIGAAIFAFSGFGLSFLIK